MSPTKLEMFLIIKAGYPNRFDSYDFDDFWNKERAFVDFIRFSDNYNLKNKTHCLFDDMVTDCKVSFENTKIEIINIKKYKG